LVIRTVGFTIGNDMSSRDIEGENLLSGVGTLENSVAVV